MPKYNELEENEVDSKMEMMESLDEDIENEIILQENVESKVSSFEFQYKKDKHVYKKEDAYGDNLDEYNDLLEYGSLEKTSEFIKTMKLGKGILNVEADLSLFNKAVIHVMKSDFKRRITVFHSSEKTNLEVNREKNSFVFIHDFDKESIIERAKELRAKCFNLLTGEGNPERANPKFVKEITEVDKDGNKTTRLAYDEKVVKKFVRSFKSDKSLYKDAISNIKTSNFHSYYNHMKFNISLDSDGNETYHFGQNTKETACEAAKNYVQDYLCLKEIHKNRPWHYWFTSPLENIFEGIYLKKIYKSILDTAKDCKFGDEMKIALDKSNKKNLNENLDSLKKAVEKTYEKEKTTAPMNEKNKVEEIQTEPQVTEKRVPTEISNELIEPVSDVPDDLHPFAVPGYGMGEATKYLTEEEFMKESDV